MHIAEVRRIWPHVHANPRDEKAVMQMRLALWYTKHWNESPLFEAAKRLHVMPKLRIPLLEKGELI